MELFKRLFNRRYTIILSVTIGLIAVVVTLLQIYVFHPKEHKIASIIMNSEIIGYDDNVSNKICASMTDHSFDKFVFCDYENGAYLGHSDSLVENAIGSFIQMKKTLLVKGSKSSTVRFINDSDTLVVVYEVLKKNGALFNGRIDSLKSNL